MNEHGISSSDFIYGNDQTSVLAEELETGDFVFEKEWHLIPIMYGLNSCLIDFQDRFLFWFLPVLSHFVIT